MADGGWRMADEKASREGAKGKTKTQRKKSRMADGEARI
jgi:hypothetical protein